MVDTNPIYRNVRKNYYTEKTPDTLNIGTVVQVFKPTSNSFDNSSIPSTLPINGTTAYTTSSGDANPGDNPEFQYPGYLYCDGSEYNIKDYPALYSIIGNQYGGSPGVGINPETVFDNWPSSTMGTFRVPDFKAKKLVGNGPVYGSGTPSIGLSELEVGINSIGGKWYFDKDAQKGEFSLGRISTTGYTNVKDSISSQLIGSQTVTVTMDEKRLQGVPQHSHQLLHSEASQDAGYALKSSGDRYLVSYKTASGKVQTFTPAGGLAFTHKHALSKRPFTSAGVATYDIYNYTGGDSGTGTIKEPGYYYASGTESSGTGAGTYELSTFTPVPTFKKFVSTSVIGNRTIVTSGTPLYNFTTYEYTTAQINTTLTLPSNFTILRVNIAGGSGSGAVYTTAGNTGTQSRVRIGDGSLLTLTASGGGGGGAASLSAGGGAGINGVSSVSGSAASNFTITSNSVAVDPTAGKSGPYWFKTVAQNPVPTDVGGTGGNNGFSQGSVGKNITVIETATYPASSATYTSDTNVTIQPSNGNYTLTNIFVELYGGAGANCGNFGGNYSTGVGSYNFSLGGCTTGAGGAGKYMKISMNSKVPTTFSVFPGPAGGGGGREGGTSNGGNGTYGDGGGGGDGYGSNDGGGGGGATVVNIGATPIAGAGGGGGGGGAGEGQCGQSGQPNTRFGDDVYGVNQNLFTGGGAFGGNYGCTGGGGGGGGGGIGTAAQSTTAGGSGGGGGGLGDHGSGDGGSRGLSSYNLGYATLVASGNTSTGAGKVAFSWVEDRSYYSSGGGGGAAGGYLSGDIDSSALTGASSLIIDVGSGASPATYNGGSSSFGSNPSVTGSTSTVSSNPGGSGYVRIRLGVVVGYEGGTTSISVGDIVKEASPGVEIYSTGTGVGSNGGFKLPTTQAPTIVFEGGGGGSGVTATANVSNNVVSSITLNNSGSAYTVSPNIRFLHGAGSGTAATVTLSQNRTVASINLIANSSTSYERYIKFGGSDLTRYIITQPIDCTNVRRFSVKAARGNGVNGGNRPENGGDELRLYYNTDGTNSFPSSNFIGVLIPIPSDTEISSNYDGSGSGSEATKWYTYSLDLPEDAQTANVQFKIIQTRGDASAANDNGSDTDHYGICDIIYEFKEITQLLFTPSEGKITTNADGLTYVVEGPANATYTSGISANDVTFTMSSGTPLIPVASIAPNIDIPLIEPYILVRHLIKAF